MSKKTIKQSLLIGALTSSFGIFISKALGLLYYTPLTALAGEENIAFYSLAYVYYDQILKISSAGIPFAIAALVAKYVAKEDYKTAKLVKQLGTSIVMALSLIMAFVFLLCSSSLAAQSAGKAASIEDVNHLKALFNILIIAIVLVPYLSTTRSYYQGLKRLDIYASSQVFEQFVRVFSIIFFGFILVKIIRLDSIYAIYAAIAAAGISAFAAILLIKVSSKKEDKRIEELIDAQESKALASKELIKEILQLGIPYLLISFFGSASVLVNSTYFLDYATSAAGMDYATAKLSYGILSGNCYKLLAIPEVLTLGFSSSLVPYLSESYEQRDYAKLSNQISQILETVLYLLIPIILVFVFFAEDVYFIMYGNKNLALSASLFRGANLYGFTDTIAPIISSIVMTLRLRKEAIVILIISFFTKLVTFFPLVKAFGSYGMILSTLACSVIAIALYLIILAKYFFVSYKTVVKRGIKILIASLVAIVPFKIIHALLNIAYVNRIKSLFIMAILGICIVLSYYFVSNKLNLPAEIFKIEKPNLKTYIKKLLRR